MVLAGNERRALEQLLQGEIGQFRSEIGLDKAAKKDDMVSSKWLPLFLYCTTDKIFRSGFQKRLATITVRELIKLPKANPHTILDLTPLQPSSSSNDRDHDASDFGSSSSSSRRQQRRRRRSYYCTPIQLAVTARDAEYGVNVLQA
ncbi:hypothetical protein FOZ62_031830 [Perkinsus olseni]|uniref:Uncharacterized protein n=1 Tax=Perkinsus olseni TaxID=32597 RepID=A0A7J6P0U9_PEROL|nr:hypothetical protein FOZ62_031830 [Perkinsus olseni]